MTREEAIEKLYLEWQKFLEDNIDYAGISEAYKMAFKALEQEPKTGHWKAVPFNSKHGEYRPQKYMCSECGWEIDLCRGLQQDTGHRLFCEHCGAKMVEP